MKQKGPPAENAISSEEDSSDREGASKEKATCPNIDPDIVAFVKEHFNDQVSDEEDNSWADELSEHGIDDYYGEEGEEAEYGEENSPVRGGAATESPDVLGTVEAEEHEEEI